jgi:hypothetical protein
LKCRWIGANLLGHGRPGLELRLDSFTVLVDEMHQAPSILSLDPVDGSGKQVA